MKLKKPRGSQCTNEVKESNGANAPMKLWGTLENLWVPLRRTNINVNNLL
jgi:hypothetical protein